MESSREFTVASIDFLSKAAALPIEEEQERLELKKDLQKMFLHMESLKEIPTENISACTHPLETVNVVRDDIVSGCLTRQELIENCPDHIAGMVRVLTIFQKE